ncbi:hypothetical protein B0H11DRAFT_193182 [Mycena galericulata]|nr:hypothetical protein B0H11DRAFT_193182 [Mycena galericulata]
MIRLDLSTTRSAGLDMILVGGQKGSFDEVGSVQMSFAVPGNPPATHLLKRVSVPGSDSGHLQINPAPHIAFSLDEQLEQGIVGPVFAGRAMVTAAGGVPESLPVVAKVALYEEETRILLHEAAMYRRLEHAQGRVVPRVFGVFAGRAFLVLVLAHRGAGIPQMAELSLAQRYILLLCFDAISEVDALGLRCTATSRRLHGWGVAHGDLRTDNIVVSDAEVPSLIDLSHARMHLCLGPFECEELHEGRSFLRLD